MWEQDQNAAQILLFFTFFQPDLLSNLLQLCVEGFFYDLQLLANSERVSKSLVFVYILNNIDVACEMHSVIHSA